MKRRPARICSLTVGMLLLTGCGDDGRGDATGPATTTPSTTTPSTTTPSTTTPSTTVPTAPGVVTIAVRVGVDDAATTGGRVEPVPLGSLVRVELTADRAIEYHLHDPYDIEVQGAAGATAVIEFTADRPGSVELERHDTGALLVLLEIS